MFGLINYICLSIISKCVDSKIIDLLIVISFLSSEVQNSSPLNTRKILRKIKPLKITKSCEQKIIVSQTELRHFGRGSEMGAGGGWRWWEGVCITGLKMMGHSLELK